MYNHYYPYTCTTIGNSVVTLVVYSKKSQRYCETSKNTDQPQRL